MMRSNSQQQMSQAAAAIRVGPSITISWMVRQLLVLSFASAFLQYWTAWTAAQYVPVLILLLAALLVLGSRYRRDRLIHLLSGGALLLTAVGFTEVVSYYSSDNYSVLYGVTLITIIIAVRLILQQIGLPEVMYSYFKAGLIITLFVLVSGRKSLISYTAGMRFTGNSTAHVNLLAFVLAGFLPVLVWRTLEIQGLWKRRFMVAVSLLDFLMIFLSGSRGSLFAVLVAGFVLLFRFVLAGKLQRILRVRHIHLILILIAVPLILGYMAQQERAAHLADFFNTALSLNSSQRGLHSGFSGRTQFWQRALRLLGEEERWFFGFGYRMGDRMVGTIDNGYLQLLFESGLISGGIILGVLLGVFFRLWRATQGRENSAWLRYHLTLWSLLIVYLVNNISTRYLFSFGNCFSVCVIFLMCASRRELLGPRAVTVRRVPSPPRSRAIPAFATAGGWSPPNG
jgi:hypothetical protein